MADVTVRQASDSSSYIGAGRMGGRVKGKTSCLIRKLGAVGMTLLSPKGVECLRLLGGEA